MLSIARSVRYVKYIKVGKCMKFNMHSKYFSSSTFIISNLKSRLPLSCGSNKETEYRQYSVQSPLEKAEEVNNAAFTSKAVTEYEDSFQFADSILKRGGFLRKKVIEELIQCIENSNNVSSTQAAYLLRCCGSSANLLSQDVRKNLVTKIWNMYQEKKIPLDISHYNLLLQVFLENEEKFSYLDFLASLHEKDIEPNRITYCRLIGNLCQEGDIDGANKILEFMKEKDLAVNESIFNYLIVGNSRAKDLHGAESILEVMKQSGIPPGPDTFATLLQCYAEHRDLDKINEILSQIEKEEIFLSEKAAMEAVVSLAENNVLHPIEKILSSIPKRQGYQNLVVMTTNRLILKGLDQVARQVLKTLHVSDSQNYTGKFFIGQLVASDIDLYKLINYCDEARTMGWNVVSYEVALEACYFEEKFDKALSLLRVMKEKGIPIKEHYFYPLFCNAKHQGRESVYSILEEMIGMEIYCGVDLVSTFLLPSLNITARLADIEEVYMRLLNYQADVDILKLYSGMVEYLLRFHNMDITAQFVNKFPRGIRRNLKNYIASNYLHTNNSSATAVLLRQMLPISIRLNREATEDEDVESQYEGILGALSYIIAELKQTNSLKERLPPLLEEMKNEGVRLLPSVVESLTQRHGQFFTPETEQLFSALSESSLFPQLNQSSTRELYRPVMSEEIIREKMKQEELDGKQTHDLKLALLNSFINQKKISEAEELMKELKSEGLSIPGPILVRLLDSYIEEQRIREAEDLVSVIKDELHGFQITPFKIVKFAELLIKNGRVQDAIKYILMLTPTDGEWTEEFTRNLEDQSYRSRIVRMLMNVVELKDLESLKLLQEALLTRNLSPPAITLTPLIKYYLSQDQMEEALKAYERIAKEYNVTVGKSVLLSALINQEDTDKIQKVMDISSKIHGDMNTLYDLAFSFIEVGKLKQAEKVLQTNGLRTLQSRLDDRCEFYLRNDKVEHVEGLVAVTKGLFNVDRNRLYQHLLEGMIARDDPEKALGLWTLMQEEGVDPSGRFLSRLGKYLKSKNLEVPFIVPAYSVSSESGSLRTSPRQRYHREKEMDPADIQSQLTLALEQQNLENVKSLWKKGTEANTVFSQPLFSRYIGTLLRFDNLTDALEETKNGLVRNQKPSTTTLKNLLGQLSDAGDVTSILFLGKYFSTTLKQRLFYDSNLRASYIAAGRTEEYVKETMKVLSESEDDQVLKARLLPSRFIKKVFEEQPQFISLVEQCAEIASEKGHNIIYYYLWDVYFSQGMDEKANELYDKYLKDLNFIPVRASCSKIFLSKDKERIKQLLAVIDRKPEGREGVKGWVLSTYIDLLNKDEKYEESVKLIEESLNTITLNNYRMNSLRTMKKEMQQKNKVFPFQIDNLRPSAQSSTSSSSSSDDEKK